MSEQPKQFTVYWRDGTRSVVIGNSAANALSRAGYGQGAVSAVDFICEGINNEYQWDSDIREWRRVEGS